MNDSINSFIKNYVLHNRISTFLLVFSSLVCFLVQNRLLFAFTICCIWLDSVCDRRISFHIYRNIFVSFTFLSQSLVRLHFLRFFFEIYFDVSSNKQHKKVNIEIYILSAGILDSVAFFPCWFAIEMECIVRLG